MGAAEAKERAAFWGALCKLLLLMPSPAEAPAAAALPEDWQLRAFGPLNAAHQRLEFQLPRAEKVNVARRVCDTAAQLYWLCYPVLNAQILRVHVLCLQLSIQTLVSSRAIVWFQAHAACCLRPMSNPTY